MLAATSTLGMALRLVRTGERGCALHDEQLAPTRYCCWCRGAGLVGRQLAARCADVDPAVAPHGGLDAGLAQRRRERLGSVERAGLPGRMRDRVHGDQVDV